VAAALTLALSLDRGRRLSTHRHHLTRTHLIMPSTPPQLPSSLLESNAQLGFGFAQPASTGEVEQAPREEHFLSGAEGDFFVGAQGLAEYLDAHQQGWVVKLKVLVSELDYSPFYGRYKDDGGRRPIHPRVMLGLIVYGITQGKWSLRELERLARMDLGAMWMSGRVQPDHSTIGKFIQLHAELLSEQFFTTLVKQLVRSFI
jgi:hypothetical protein